MDFDDHDDPEDDLPDLHPSSTSTPTPTPHPHFSSPPPPPLPNSSKPQDHHHHHLPHISSSSNPRRPTPRYRECLKNHAVGIGGHAVDGCGEFMPGGEEGTLDALKCAACSCHRNFHRKVDPSSASDSPLPLDSPSSSFHHHHHHHHPSIPPYYRSPYLHHHHPSSSFRSPPPPPPLALPSTSGGGGGSRDDDDLSPGGDPFVGGGVVGSSGGSRKRFRTKFTQEQKERMLCLAERLGWRIQKHDEAVVQQFCAEVGVKRHVLKVWMHNNKHTLGKKPPPPPPNT